MHKCAFAPAMCLQAAALWLAQSSWASCAVAWPPAHGRPTTEFAQSGVPGLTASPTDLQARIPQHSPDAQAGNAAAWSSMRVWADSMIPDRPCCWRVGLWLWACSLM